MPVCPNLHCNAFLQLTMEWNGFHHSEHQYSFPSSTWLCLLTVDILLIPSCSLLHFRLFLRVSGFVREEIKRSLFSEMRDDPSLHFVFLSLSLSLSACSFQEPRAAESSELFVHFSSPSATITLYFLSSIFSFSKDALITRAFRTFYFDNQQPPPLWSVWVCNQSALKAYLVSSQLLIITILIHIDYSIYHEIKCAWFFYSSSSSG